MKLLKIFGIVIALHAIALTFIFAIPGCRSTGRPKPPVTTASNDPGTDSPVSATAASSTTEPPLISPSPVSPTPAEEVRFSPTRPGGQSETLVPSPVSPDYSPISATPAPVVPATYVVEKGDNLTVIAKKHGLTVKALAAANNLKPESTLRIGQKLLLPGTTAPADTAAATATTPNAYALPGELAPASAPAATPSAPTSYTVKSGDTLSGIARSTGSTVAAIKKLNKLPGDRLRLGQVLLIPSTTPAGATGANPAGPGTTNNPGPTSKASDKTPGLIHTVQAGEHLGTLAKQYQVKAKDIAVLNNIADPTKLRIGQKLKIPGVPAPTALAAAQPPVATAAPSPYSSPALTPSTSPASAVPSAPARNGGGLYPSSSPVEATPPRPAGAALSPAPIIVGADVTPTPPAWEAPVIIVE